MSDTVCKSCIFAEYSGLTQTGCTRGMLDKFRERGAKVIDAYDHDKEFNVIKNRTCRFFRTQDWLNRFEGKNKEEIEQFLSLESTLKFHAILPLKDKDENDAKITIDSLLSEPYKPAQITLIRQPDSETRPRELAELFKDCPINWRVQQLLYKQPHEKVIHEVNRNIPANYYFVADVGHIFEPNFLANINHAVNYELIQFAMIEHNGTVVIPSSVHNYWYFEGDASKTVPENIRDYQCRNPKEKMIYSLEEIQNLNVLRT